MRRVEVNTAYDLMVFMADATDGRTGKAGLTLTITAGKAGGAFGSITPTITDRGSGWYKLALTTGHLDTEGDFALHITATGADPTDIAMQVGPGPANVVKVGGTAQTAGDLAAAVASLAAVLATTAHAQPAQGAPPAAANLVYILTFLYKVARNKVTSDGDIKVWNDAGTDVDHKASQSDSGVGGLYTRNGFVSGP